jgi:S1-C subfamily serine protease
LKELKSVRLIRCYGTLVTKEAADRFQAEMVAVQVDHKAGAFLGVVCQQPPWPCEVIQVKEQSAAMQGGIQVRDIIVRYDGKPVANFEELRKLIGQNQVGDSVAVEVARGGQPVAGVLLCLPGQELGLEGESTAYGCKVKKVKDESAAAKAGLRIGDVIVAFDDERIADVGQLQQLYDKNVERKEAEIQVLRDVRIVRAKVTFGEWNE